MPIAIACPCGFSATVPDAYGGKTGKCKRCGRPIQIPPGDDGDAAVATFLPDPDPEPPSAFVAPAIDTSRDEEGTPESPPVAPMGREPWYYRFLVIYAYLIIGVGTALGLIWIVVVLVASLRAAFAPATPPIGEMPFGRADFTFRQPAPPGPFVVLLGLTPALAMIFVSCVIGAPILLGVDAARNLRVIRLQGHIRSS